MSAAESTIHCEVATLYTDHHGWLQAWLRRKLGDSFDAADLAHDTFMRVLGKPHGMAAVQEPRAWLVTIAHGLVVDHVRRRALERACLDAIAHLPEPQAPSPEARLMLIEALVQIDALLDGLAPKVRTAFLLSRLEGLSYIDIAAHLGVCLSSVEKYMATAIRHCMAVRAAL
jgi:RNA polymerase sigma-70 factor (ECF subfamily)